MASSRPRPRPPPPVGAADKCRHFLRERRGVLSGGVPSRRCPRQVRWVTFSWQSLSADSYSKNPAGVVFFRRPEDVRSFFWCGQWKGLLVWHTPCCRWLPEASSVETAGEGQGVVPKLKSSGFFSSLGNNFQPP